MAQVAFKMMTIKKEERAVAQTTHLFSRDSSKEGHPNSEVKVSPSVFKDSNKLEVSNPRPQVADGRIKAQLVVGAAVVPNLVVGKEVKFLRLT